MNLWIRLVSAETARSRWRVHVFHYYILYVITTSGQCSHTLISQLCFNLWSKWNGTFTIGTNIKFFFNMSRVHKMHRAQDAHVLRGRCFEQLILQIHKVANAAMFGKSYGFEITIGDAHGVA